MGVRFRLVTSKCFTLSDSSRAIFAVLASLSFILASWASSSPSCPSSCSFISPVPYPFGAAPGCGAPGFQLSNCSGTPRWDLVLGVTPHVYYVRSISPLPNSKNQSLGFGGSIILAIVPQEGIPICQIASPLYNITAFSTTNLYAFEPANLTFSDDKYLFFNCTKSDGQKPTSGTLTVSSSSCRNFLRYCNYSSAGSCLEYTPFQDLYLPTVLNAYNCSSYRRFIIGNENDPVETWMAGLKLIWGSVKDVDMCTSCQNTEGTCGYNTQDNSFLCFCGDGASNSLDCKGKNPGNRKAIIAATTASVAVLALGVITIVIYVRYPWWILRHGKQFNLDDVHQVLIDFPYRALVAATRNFSDEIGHGAFGKVYKGSLPDGNEVAVKVLNASISHSKDQFFNEVASIGCIHHLNIARLFGFCFNKSKRILVYEYVSNGSLDKHLFLSEHASKPVLNWKQRFNIAVGIARGLYYMHEECRSCIIHCDIKPQNILLDASYSPKIADFGLAKLLSREESRVLTQARGTPGYVAPEFWRLGHGPLTTKFDVYSYGMMLLEIIRGEKCINQFNLFSFEGPTEFDDWMSVSVDERIMEDADILQVRNCTLVAFWCVQEEPTMRPTMGTVIQYLEGTLEVPADVPPPYREAYWYKKLDLNGELTSDISLNS
ncbi:hypothetical protein KP509_1Z159100 [Ceratopteris richardii]|nr:hypothetical protein KP509_1Z159100 [Ceratopteris richardii]